MTNFVPPAEGYAGDLFSGDNRKNVPAAQEETTGQVPVLYESEIFGKTFCVYGTRERPLFLARDIAQWIEYDAGSTNKLLDGVDEAEKLNGTIFRSGQGREMWFLTEDGLYEVLFQSRKPIAKEFKKQVKTVLRSIRETGGYISGQETASEDELISRALVIANNIISRKTKQIEELKPKAEFFDQVTSSKDAIDMREAAKVLNIKGIGRNNLFQFLRDERIFMENNTPFQAYIDRGYFRVIESKWTAPDGETHISFKTVVYQRGLDFIRRRLGEDRRRVC
ncbi:MAG: phage antirepressor Ant [Treponema sp.]|nr:MAG: phage antirepressor Ant [Treponema sp.]